MTLTSTHIRHLRGLQLFGATLSLVAISVATFNLVRRGWWQKGAR